MLPATFAILVFFREFEVGNLLIDPKLNEDDRTYLINMIPALDRHGLFGSLRSSQALTQTVFGSLAAMGRLDLLANLETEEGERPFQPGPLGQADLQLEVKVSHLNEPRPTSKDRGILRTEPCHSGVQVHRSGN